MRLIELLDGGYFPVKRAGSLAALEGFTGVSDNPPFTRVVSTDLVSARENAGVEGGEAGGIPSNSE